MSYILEALKKAQAERQIGSTPTIHAPTLASAPAGQGARSKRVPVIVAMTLMAAAIAGLATMLVRQQAVQAPQQATPVAPMAVAPQHAPAAPQSAPPPAPTQSPAAQNAASVEAAPPAAAPQATTAQQMPPPRTSAGAVPQPAGAEANGAGAMPAAGPAASSATSVPATAAAAPTPPLAAPAPEEHVQSLQELPEPIQRAIPQVTLGGYMYSKNPSDRLLLIDKVLRREGEEVAPGLVLEKLLPKQAIFSFRGYRYRIGL